VDDQSQESVQGTTAQAESTLFLGRQQMLIRKRQAFAEMSTEASLRLAAVWSGAVGGLLLIMVLVRHFS
jgi:hypothetical protein